MLHIINCNQSRVHDNPVYQQVKSASLNDWQRLGQKKYHRWDRLHELLTIAFPFRDHYVLYTCLLRDRSRICYALIMKTQTTQEQTFALAFATSWNRLEKRLDSALGAIRGISFAEYRLLRALADAPNNWASRVDLAQAVGLTPSGVTRALRPMEKLGYVTTAKSKRDARLALATLSPPGQELVLDASGVVNDMMKTVLERARKTPPQVEEMIELLGEFGR